MKKKVIIVIAVILILIGAYLLYKKMGEGVFDVIAIDTANKKVTLQEKSGGKPIVIDLTSNMSTSMGKDNRFTIDHKKKSDTMYTIEIKDSKYNNNIVKHRDFDFSKQDQTSQLGPL